MFALILVPVVLAVPLRQIVRLASQDSDSLKYHAVIHELGADGVDLIVYGVNPPKYRWQGAVLPLLETRPVWPRRKI